ncbi:DUF5713 family protein [Kitasatospora cineracea]|uniref:DUF5713 family protein n=1 Tax=Kitasatospora cineracea TaxID=88074 RepID=UPI00379975D5
MISSTCWTGVRGGRGGIEAVAREWICDEFCFVASAFEFTDAEELTAGRDW